MNVTSVETKLGSLTLHFYKSHFSSKITLSPSSADELLKYGGLHPSIS